MKKILLFLLLLVPLLANAQDWFTANAVRFDFGKGWGEWEKRNVRVLQDRRVVKVFARETHIFIQASDEYAKEEDARGNSLITWGCVDAYGEKCVLQLIYNADINAIYLKIIYRDKSICYNLIPD